MYASQVLSSRRGTTNECPLSNYGFELSTSDKEWGMWGTTFAQLSDVFRLGDPETGTDSWGLLRI